MDCLLMCSGDNMVQYNRTAVINEWALSVRICTSFHLSSFCFYSLLFGGNTEQWMVFSWRSALVATPLPPAAGSSTHWPQSSIESAFMIAAPQNKTTLSLVCVAHSTYCLITTDAFGYGSGAMEELILQTPFTFEIVRFATWHSCDNTPNAE